MWYILFDKKQTQTVKPIKMVWKIPQNNNLKWSLQIKTSVTIKYCTIKSTTFQNMRPHTFVVKLNHKKSSFSLVCWEEKKKEEEQDNDKVRHKKIFFIFFSSLFYFPTLFSFFFYHSRNFFSLSYISHDIKKKLDVEWGYTESGMRHIHTFTFTTDKTIERNFS